MRLFATIFLCFSLAAEYEWLSDIVGIDQSKFNYKEGSDPELELYVKENYVNDIKLSPDGNFLAFQSDSDVYTQGILVVDRKKFFENNMNVGKATIARLAVDEPGAPDLGIRRLFLCNFNWASNNHILVELCGKTIDYIQGEIFFNIGIFKIFDLEKNEFRNFLYPFGKIRTRVNDSFQDRYKPATFISRFDNNNILVSVSENRRGFRFAHLRKISLDKKGTDPNGETVYISDVPCQFRAGYRTNNFCDQPSIYLLDENKKPVITFSSNKDTVFAHTIGNKTQKIDVDLEEYGIVGYKNNQLWLLGDPEGNTQGVSVLNLRDRELERVTPSECHSTISSFFSVDQSTPYAVEMECEGKKDFVLLNDSRDSQILSSLSRSFQDKTLQLSSWTDDGTMALLKVSDSSSVTDIFILDIVKGSLEFIASTTYVPKRLLHKNESRTFTAEDGTKIHGYLTKPKTAIKKLFVYVHGGPYGVRDFDEYDPFEQYLASKGIAVLKVNFRGSGGYGKNFLETAYQEWGGMLLDDIASATKQIQKELNLSKNQTCLGGASYGGYAALAMSYKYSELYDCVLGMIGIFDLLKVRDGTDDGIYAKQPDFKEDVAEPFFGYDDDRLKDFSPVYNADKIDTRVMMWSGLQDPISPVIHLKWMKEALEEEGVPFKAFTMTRLSHTYGREDDMKAMFPVMKDYILNQLN